MGLPKYIPARKPAPEPAPYRVFAPVHKKICFSDSLARAVERIAREDVSSISAFVRSAVLHEIQRRGLQKYLTTAS